MEQIKIQTKETEYGWKFEVEIAGQTSKTDHQVTMDRDFCQKITKGKITPQDLVKKSFEFLLEHEPKESILSEFNITLIAHYFPQFEEEITKRIG